MGERGAGRAAPPAVAPLTEIFRGEVVESRHRGSIAVVDAEGRLLAEVGDAALVTYWRSAAKPLQALPVITTGAADHFGLEPEHLAVMCASHAGRDDHVAAVTEALARAGVPIGALRCEVPGRDGPRHGCSGNHTGMLVTARHLGEPLETYPDPDHPVQRRIRAVLGTLGEVDPASIPSASDGCSVPTFAMSLRQMALAFARLIDPADLAEPLRGACRRMVAAMQAHPDLLAGAEGDTRNLTSALVRTLSPAAIGKSGAESIFCVGIRPGVLGPRGVGVVVKAEDGGPAPRSCYLATVEALRQLGVASAAQVSALDPYLERTIRNVHGQVAGGARACFQLGPVERR
ncbi:MAG: asparaginase [Chloroflexota bacterium]